MYITAAYDIVVKKNRKNSTPELRSLSYLEEIEVAVNSDEEIFQESSERTWEDQNEKCCDGFRGIIPYTHCIRCCKIGAFRY